jgi:O-antigen/teichoic acid export membrane protein
VSVREQALGPWPQSRMRTAFETLKSTGSESKVLTGSAVMLAGSVLVSLANFGYNIGVAHLLGPGDFSHAAAAVTLLMLASCINLAYQLVAAKLIAKTPEPDKRAAVYQYLMRRAWLVGFGLSATIVGASRWIAGYLRMPSPTLIVLLGLGMLFYIPLGVRRGGMQGTCQFVRLSLNLAAEAFVKLISAMILVLGGAGILGAVGAISLSVFAAFLLPAGDHKLRQAPAAYLPVSFLESIQAIIFFIGQVIINNVDILMVKHYFAPDAAGIYAAVALVGRLLYFATWSVTTAMFPISAGSAAESDSRRVLVVPLLFVAGLSSVFVVFLASFPGLVIRTLFGSDFHRVGAGVEQLLAMNAVATAVYAVCVVLITYEMSRRIANTGWLQLVVSLLIILSVAAFHDSLMQVIVIQQVLRGLLLIAVSIPFFRRASGVPDLGREAA